jgi:molybdopterin-guanine dinucleotide biosynthesis protein A
MTLGVILAGGASSRMGTDKALIEIGGSPLVEWVADALLGVCETVVVAGREGLVAGLRCLPDTHSDVRGPLAGLATGLTLGERLVLVGVDQPFVEARTIERLLSLEDGHSVVPFDEQRQVTCAVYPASLRESVDRELEMGGSIQSLLDRIPHRLVEEAEWRSWGEDGRSWFSVDTPEDLVEGLARWGAPG